jgi:hypothetical protein
VKLTPFRVEDYLTTEEARTAYAEEMAKPVPLGEDWMRVGPNTDAAIWRPWGRESGEL